MKIGICEWNGRVSPVFDTAGNMRMIEISEGKILNEKNISLLAPTIYEKINILKRNNIEVLICGGIWGPTLNMLIASGIKVIPWITGKIEDILKAYLEGRLLSPQFIMPGCKAHRRRFRHGQRFMF